MTSTGYGSNNTRPYQVEIAKAHEYETATDTNKADAARDQRSPTTKTQFYNLLIGKAVKLLKDIYSKITIRLMMTTAVAQMATTQLHLK